MGKKKYKEKCSFMRGEVARLILRRFPCRGSGRRRIKERRRERGEKLERVEEEEEEEAADENAVYLRRGAAGEGWFMRVECVRTQLPF